MMFTSKQQGYNFSGKIYILTYELYNKNKFYICTWAYEILVCMY